ncbi:hypothetical protein RchiOBHm_Chr2g0140171 [Rosa chinensis]|uniref:Uncharacterized protein n=1 Tax=Rosa chinensis TaxID=74649 RepID=A0A2P6RXB2_ROSCH|nr:hypothetical protein RchiOBHm_Chr2g0140171 [Rosa chinensis]
MFSMVTGLINYGQQTVWAARCIGQSFMITLSHTNSLPRGFMLAISPYHNGVGRRGLCPGLHTLCALSALGRRRVPKWSQPPSGRMKLSVIGRVFGWQHSGKADLISIIWLRVSIYFPVCHHLCKANRIAKSALFAIWCMVEYIFFC